MGCDSSFHSSPNIIHEKQNKTKHNTQPPCFGGVWLCSKRHLQKIFWKASSEKEMSPGDESQRADSAKPNRIAACKPNTAVLLLGKSPADRVLVKINTHQQIFDWFKIFK